MLCPARRRRHPVQRRRISQQSAARQRASRRAAAGRDGLAVRQPREQRSLDDEQQVAAHAGQRPVKRKGSAERRWATCRSTSPTSWPGRSPASSASCSAIPLALRFGKRGHTLGIALAIIAFFAYYLMVSAAFRVRPQRRDRSIPRGLDSQRHRGCVAGGLSSLAGRALTACLARCAMDVAAMPRLRCSLPSLLQSIFRFRHKLSAQGCDQQQNFALLLLQHADVRPAHYRDDRADSGSGFPADSRTAGHARASERTAGRQQRHLSPSTQPRIPSPVKRRRVTPPPIPSGTPNPLPSLEPIFLVRSGETPPPITPAGQATPAPTPETTGVPTLSPGYIAVISDSWSGNRARGKPSDAVGNVHIYYADEEIVGERAHFDGVRTMTITGHPFIVNHEHNSILAADTIIFDTVEQTAKLRQRQRSERRGTRARSRSFFGATTSIPTRMERRTATSRYVTTCENPRGGYHITGKNMDVYPGR